MQNISDITIRTANCDDAPDVVEVVEAAFASLRSIYRPTGALITRQSERAKEGTRLIAELDGAIVGTVQFDEHEGHVHIIGLAVHPKFQRLGIARQLIDWIVEHAPNIGHQVVVLDTIKETGNVPLFERLGFKVFYEEITTLFESDTYTELHEVKMKRNVAE